MARVDREEITLQELRQFKAVMPALLRSEAEGAEELKDYLQTMIDMELLLLEARAQGIDREPQFLQDWEGEREQKLVVEMLQRQIQQRIDLPSAEVQQHFAESRWSRMLKLAHIRVQTEAEARQVAEALERGHPFEELARARSADRETALRGGMLDPYFGRGNIEEFGLPVEIAEELFELPVGQVSRPLRLGEGYEIFKVVDERPAPAGYALVFAQWEWRSAFQARRQELLAELRQRLDPRMDGEGVALLVQRGAVDQILQLSEQERQKVLCRFEGGQITLGDFAAIYPQVNTFRAVEFDSSGIAQVVDQYLLPQALLYRAALQEQLDRDSAVEAWLEAKKKSMLIDSLRRREVEGQIDLSDEAVRRYYEGHLERFMDPPEFRVVEILSKSREEAESFLQRVRRGENLEELAARHTLREGAARHRGRFHLHSFEGRQFGKLLEAVRQAEVGKVQGPIELEKGYSVFEVVEKIPPRPQPFEEAARRARYFLKEQEGNQRFDALLQRLREKYASEVVRFEDRLERVNTHSES